MHSIHNIIMYRYSFPLITVSFDSARQTLMATYFLINLFHNDKFMTTMSKLRVYIQLQAE